MQRYLAAVIALSCWLFCAEAFAQPVYPPAKPLRWDVISVKPMSEQSCANDGGLTVLPDGISSSCLPLAFIVESAYRLLDQDRILGLPKWAESESQLYGIEARVSGEDASAFGKLSRDDQFRMLQQILTDRFQMKAHIEVREIQAYALVIAKGGPKLKTPAPDEPGSSSFGTRTGNIEWANSPLTNLKFLLGKEAGKPVFDKTGLTGKYDFTLNYMPAAHPDDTGRPSVFTALEEQLGLKLVPAKEPVDLLVIDSIEQPEAN